MEDLNFRKGDAKTEVFGSNDMLQPSPVDNIPYGTYYPGNRLSDGERRNIRPNAASL